MKDIHDDDILSRIERKTKTLVWLTGLNVAVTAIAFGLALIMSWQIR